MLWIVPIKRRVIVAACAAILLVNTNAEAGLIISVETKLANPGTADYLEVSLGTDATVGQTLSGFSIQLILAGSGVTFLGVDEQTALNLYVFDNEGLGLASPDSFPNTQFTASDLSFNSDGYVTLDPNTTYGLARIEFQVDNNAGPGLRPITFGDIGVSTDFSDQFGASYTNVTFVDGGVNVSGNVGAVPEPASLTLLGIGALSIAGVTWRRRRRS